MKILIIYHSVHHQNTLKVADVMAQSIEADLIDVSEANQDMLDDYDVVGFGSGIYYGKPHKKIRRFIEGLIKQENKKAFVFITSGAGKANYPQNLSNILVERGFEVIGEYHTKAFDTWGYLKLIGGINKGRPNQEDLQKAEDFARNLKERLY
jgi:flavodoxin